MDKSKSEELFITIADLSEANAQKFTQGHPNAKGSSLMSLMLLKEVLLFKLQLLSFLCSRLDFISPLLKTAILYKKHLVTASYVSDEMQALDEEAKANGLVFMNEIGVDPGIDT